MLDFASQKTPPYKMRCQRRARVARGGARLLLIALGGLVGVALAVEPKMATSLRASLETLPGEVRTVVARTTPFAAAVPIGEGQLPDTADNNTVARADTSLLRP